jgi:predicted metalloenzyme YecM
MTINSYQDIKNISQPYTTRVLDFLQQHDLSDSLIADHICIKCRSGEEYDQVRKIIESAKTTQFSYQAVLTGRRIAYCKLADGIPFGGSTINFIELSDHKKSDNIAGVHHIEFYPTAGTLQQLISILDEKNIHGDLKERPHHTSFDITMPDGFVIRLSEEPLIRKISQEIVAD